MEIILETTLSYDPREPHLEIRVDNDDAVDTAVLERRYAGWYATLDYTDADGIPRSLHPNNWTRYRDTYILEYYTDDMHYTVKITEHTKADELSICVFKERIDDDDKIHADIQAPAK